jgi:hypothetical protein
MLQGHKSIPTESCQVRFKKTQLFLNLEFAGIEARVPKYGTPVYSYTFIGIR